MKPSISLRSLRTLRSPILHKHKQIPRLTASFLRTNTFQPRTFTKTTTKMSFSNTDTGSKTADPYTAKNKDETSIQEKVEDLSAFVKACKFGMMTTRDGSSGALVSRCMALAAQETGGIDLIFHTNTESGKTNDIDSDSHINISFLNSSGEWASVSGKASILTDRSVVKKYYSPTLKAWLGDLGDGKHDGSENDPRIGVIRVEAVTATYAVVRKNAVSRAAEMAQGVITGKAPAVNKLRELSEQDIATWRSSNKMVN
ncbi:BLI-3 blue-light-inducible Bli-3 protein [Cadophora gregata]|uniref:BLI-3 blue-light-inducible Bli-3 protein n=1 Tax=Cadophora gregata TaxID=51156 RepID=UPI0026DCE86F|nr:BLI-3 blue-light-inducible Bli-3 protein [Cadophora gregata]KAK0129232.1 BLI-3 blue-light-inducible Bli-3 protein [Cadophora gregata]